MVAKQHRHLRRAHFYGMDAAGDQDYYLPVSDQRVSLVAVPDAARIGKPCLDVAVEVQPIQIGGRRYDRQQYRIALGGYTDLGRLDTVGGVAEQVEVLGDLRPACEPAIVAHAKSQELLRRYDTGPGVVIHDRPTIGTVRNGQ